MTLPNFLVIGTAKAGTSSVAGYLERHPDVCFSRVQEPNYFAFDTQFARGESYYRSLYAHHVGEACIGEKSWRYSCNAVYPQAFTRLTMLLPKLKLIYVLRDPLPRAISMWRELRDSGQDEVSSDPNVALLTDPLIRNSMLYHETYRRFAGHYGADNLKIVLFEDLKSNPTEFYRNITDFLEIAPYNPNEEIHENPSVGLRSDGRVLEWLRKSGLDHPLRKTAPDSLRRLARNTLKSPIDSIEIRSETRDAFLQWVAPEAGAALELAQKKRSVWTLP